MKLAQISALSAAIFMATSAQANAFLDESSLDLELRNFYQTKTKDDGSTDSSNSQWAQGVRLDFSSGYFQNIVGLDLGGYYSLKLGASDIDGFVGNPGLLRVDSDGDSHSYGKTSYAIKFNLADMGVAKYGRMFLDTPLVNDSDSRVLPSLSEGFYADITVSGLSAHTAWITKGNGKTESGFEDYEVGDDSEAVMTLGGAYDFGNGLELSADYASQSNYAKKYLGEASFSTEVEGVEVGVAGQYGQVDLTGDSKPTTGDKSQYTYGLKVAAGVGHADFGVAYTKVESTDLGPYKIGWAGGDDDTGYFGYNSIQISDFNSNGQKAWGFSAGYDFEGIVDGLSVKGIYVMGEVKSEDETEYNLDINYAIPQVEGLTARLRYANNTVEAKGADDVVKTDTRVILKYNVAVF
ncbi:OprD family outer membrane porin [Endozoicomonas sp. 8E]|uniref:OprD family outer membrane porin n=1 Tax=Endozoicomonas sp. 8E TaxID=3035692 RepID=UPI002938D778|nr:OprD family outer membrane porin [Endozoicomonas sp. 8E]WOG26123.1 OprD family outer membrane porin [Endozoicomonas sp. 8E]